MIDSNQWLQQVSQRLAANGFNQMPPQIYQPQNFKFAAHRSRFEITKFGIAENFFIFAEIPNLTVGALQGFSSTAFQFAKANKSSSLPDGFFTATFCFAVAITANVPRDFAEYIFATAPIKHWSAFEMSVVFDVTNGGLYYFTGTPLWGAAYYNGFRREIQANLAG
ncbi:MAG TPA: hypothetical protein PKE69_07565 [Pyrinomonadaceae bacterium]|nr:hypothetical protein [Pyrinomonadaceae bacterium]